MSQNGLRAIKTQLSGSGAFGEDGPGTRSGRRSARGRSQPFFIGVAGGTASGKTTVCDQIMQRLHDQCVVMLSQDSFYRGLTPEECKNISAYSFDEPDAFDTKALVHTLQSLKAMQAVQVPVYDFKTHQRSKLETRRVEPADVVIVEGILVLHMEAVRQMLNMKIYVDTDDDVRLARRIQRDVAVRGRDVASVIQQYTEQVKPAFDQYVAPSRKHADVIIPWVRDENVVAIDLITQHIRMKLQQPDLRRVYHSLEVIPSNFQIRGMHTILRDQNTNKTDFVFIADRLLRLVVEAGLGFLPFTEHTVITPTGSQYVGVDFAKRLCGVSIIRSGESMENALRACCKGIKIGKILVHREKRRGEQQCEPKPAMRHIHQSNGIQSEGTQSHGVQSNGISEVPCRVRDQLVEQELIYEKLPKDIAERHVLLMDPILATGNSAARAIQVLLDKGVDEGKILFLSLIAAPEGIHKICGIYPRVKVVTSEIDEGIAPDFQVIPGVGEFGDRYFCD